MGRQATATRHTLDSKALYRRLDQIRMDAGVSWREVARDVGVPPTTFTRLSKGEGLSANALVALLVWMEMDEPVKGLIKENER